MALELGTNGVRARFDGLNAQTASDFGFSFAKFIQDNVNKKDGFVRAKGGEADGNLPQNGENNFVRIALARDMRKTSPCIFQAVASGLMEGGADVLDMGILPSPIAEWACAHWKADGLIIVTASHNAPEWNALKFVDWNGVAISRERGKNLNEYVGKPHLPSLDWKQIGKMEFIGNQTVFEEYKKSALAHLDAQSIRNSKNKKIKIIADPGNGTATLIAPDLLRSLGADVMVINEKLDGTFPGRQSEPTEANVSKLIEAVKSSGADFGVAWDGDADRVIFVDEKGRWLVGDVCVALCADWALIQHKSKTDLAYAKDVFVATTSATSRVVEDVAKMHGAKIVYTDVGAPYLAEKIHSLGSSAICGGEEVGGIVFPSFSLAKDGIFASCKILEMVCHKPLSQWADLLPKYYNAKTKVDADAKEKKMAMAKLVKEISLGAKEKNIKLTNLIGGFRIDFEDSWSLIRASGTEEYIRIFAEAKTENEANELMKKFKKMAQKAMK